MPLTGPDSPMVGHGSFWDWDYKNLGPRVAFAWAPNRSTGLLGSLFGAGKTSIRGGFGIVYDRFGQGIIDDFDKNGSFGLSTLLSNNATTENPAIAPRLTDMHEPLPMADLAGNQMLIPAPTANFPQPFPSGNFQAAPSEPPMPTRLTSLSAVNCGAGSPSKLPT